MTLVHVPAHVPACPLLTSTPAGAQDLATDLRAAAIAIADVHGWAASIAAPAWEGDTARAHEHAATRVAVRLDAGVAALDRAVTAVDRFGERLVRLLARRARLDGERTVLNGEIDALAADVLVAAESRLPELRRRAAALAARAGELRDRVDAWRADREQAEAALVTALREVDSVPEGMATAADPARPDPGVLAGRLRRLRGDPVALAEWWRGLSPAERTALITAQPALVGQAAGVPMADRDRANRGDLARDLDRDGERERDGQLNLDEERALANARAVQKGLDKYRDLLDPVTGRHLTELVVYTPELHSGDGGVAVAFGDPDTADHVSVTVPGLTTDTGSVSGNLPKTLDLHQAAVAEGQGSVASVYWADYDAPNGNPLDPLDPLGRSDVDGVALPVKAAAGGERLLDFVAGVRASDQGPPAQLTVVGHSYGSTTLGHALLGGLPVDDAVLLGSPGVPAATAGELTDAQVWVGSKDHDPVSLLGSGDRGGLGPLGHDPADVAFGGTRFATGDGGLRAEELLANHTSYFTGASLANVGHVVVGADEEVVEQPSRGADGGGHLTLPELLATASAASVADGLAEAGTWLWEHGPLGAMS